MKYGKKCKDCVYWRFFDLGCYACWYALDTGELRGCPASKCDKKETDPNKKKKKRVI